MIRLIGSRYEYYDDYVYKILKCTYLDSIYYIPTLCTNESKFIDKIISKELDLIEYSLVGSISIKFATFDIETSKDLIKKFHKLSIYK